MKLVGDKENLENYSSQIKLRNIQFKEEI